MPDARLSSAGMFYGSDTFHSGFEQTVACGHRDCWHESESFANRKQSTGRVTSTGPSLQIASTVGSLLPPTTSPVGAVSRLPGEEKTSTVS